ncbi:DUF3419 family protein [Roseibium sediminicola]|uniref:BtaA family protein n=1 Tax=Roseibium sediminicola TaxID=2933272 RepID=A0ABT0GQP6_9HYPH|nr:DUF3419 family protein [Roseibium sp. CAU 1639]MCK7611173.1 BtaA family protein [Roseibium sp. CAU 1639]
MTQSIDQRARFDAIRYARAWEDADVLLGAMQPQAGQRFLSICAAGDNALALLLLDPKEVVAADLSPAQIACLRLRIAAYLCLSHAEFLELIGVTNSARRPELLEQVLQACDPETQTFWREHLPDVTRFGAGNIGKFENYFRLFRRYILPLIHSRRTIESVFIVREKSAREVFFEARWNNRRWKLATSLFFSKTVMGWLGRDPAFFDHVEGSAGAHVRRKVRFAAVDQDPSENPYMRHILTGTNDGALPTAWRPENYAIIAERVDRITLVTGPVDRGELGVFDGFNLSDIFEYMSVAETAEVYGRLLERAAPGARFVYWNMMAPRSAPSAFAGRVRRLPELEARMKQVDKAFFYADLVIEETDS